MKLDQIADQIQAHLFKMDWCYSPSAYRAGSRVMIRYVSYHYIWSLTKDEALAYLQRLDQGYGGRHNAGA